MRQTVLALSILALTALPTRAALAHPAQVVIIRHGEKPETGNELDQQGCERAFLLPSFFTTNALVNRYGPPVAIYGQRPNNDSGSLRPVQTVAPTAVALGEVINDNFVRKDVSGIAQDILSNERYTNRTVLIAWEHVMIPLLAQALGLNVPPSLQKWHDSVFDAAWILSFSQSGSTSLQVISEGLLPSDSVAGPPLSPALVQQCLTNAAINTLLPKVLLSPLP